MLPVSPHDANKAEILQERQKRLAKWKQKKAHSDEQSKTKQENLTNSKNTNHDRQAERRQKLQEWKDKRRKRNEESSDKQSPQPREQKKRKSSMKGKTKNNDSANVFDASDDEEFVSTKVELFVPKTSSSKDGSNAVLSHGKRETTKNDKDPLDEYMQGIHSIKGTSTNNRIGYLFDEEDNDTGVEDMAFERTDTNEDTRYAKIAKMKLKKQVLSIKYTSEDLEPFRKNFYVQPEEFDSMSESEIEEIRLSMGNIKVKGNQCPVPVSRWSQLGLSSDVMNLITQDFDYGSPTPIQSQAIPAIMSGRDVIGISKTGSGKTISYLLPLIRQIKAQRPLSRDETGPLGLILAPTRELALQINEEVQKFIRGDDSVSSICCTGGSELKHQINVLRRGIEIIVATPGRFIDLLTLNSGKLINTKRITFVVMDEADRLFDLGFEPQITQIMKTIRSDKQCVLFSATFPNKLRSFALRVLRSPLTVTVTSNSLVNENVKQKFEIVDGEEKKFLKLLKILNESIKTEDEEEEELKEDDEPKDEKIIIFVSSQQICDILFKKLECEGYHLFSIHAGKPYQERLKNLENFRSTKNSILICTEVLSRGLNVPEVSLVIIFNAVKTFAQYVHTTGRTARGTNKGVAITLLLENELAASFILSKALRTSELEEHDEHQVRALKDMSAAFTSGIKEGRYKVSSGFGGKGLDNLESKREEKQMEQKKRFEGGNASSHEDGHRQSNQEDDNNTTHIKVPKIEYTVIKNSNTDGTITYSARVNVNDLPQLVRWEVTKNTTLMLVKRETGCSITNKGRYYPEGKLPESPRDEPKLYLLLESKEEKDIRLSIDILEQKVKEGVRKVSNNFIKDTKY